MVGEAVLELEDLLHYGLLPNLPKVIFHDTLQIKHIVFDWLPIFTQCKPGLWWSYVYKPV